MWCTIFHNFLLNLGVLITFQHKLAYYHGLRRKLVTGQVGLDTDTVVEVRSGIGSATAFLTYLCDFITFTHVQLANHGLWIEFCENGCLSRVVESTF